MDAQRQTESHEHAIHTTASTFHRWGTKSVPPQYLVPMYMGDKEIHGNQTAALHSLFPMYIGTKECRIVPSHIQ